MHRTRRTYLRPPEHPGPESVMLGGTVRVKRGGTATLHTTDEQHAQLLAEGWQEAPEQAAPTTAQIRDAERLEGMQRDARRKKGEVTNA